MKQSLRLETEKLDGPRPDAGSTGKKNKNCEAPIANFKERFHVEPISC